MLINDLQKANIEAMKAKDQDARSILSVVLTKYKLQEVEARSQGKEIGDNECLSIIQKVIKELGDEKEGYLKVNNAERVASITKQEETLKSYLPKQLSLEEVKVKVNEIIDQVGATSIKEMGKVMGAANKALAGLSDGRTISTVVKELLGGSN